MPQPMVLGPWHEIWEAFLYYKSNKAAEYDRLINDTQPWPKYAQMEGSSYEIRVGFAKQQSRIWHGPTGWTQGFWENPKYDNTFE